MVERRSCGLRRQVRVAKRRVHADCNGFWPKLLQVGTKMLLFGRGDGRSFYSADICLPQAPASEADAYLKDFGPGNPPQD